MWWNKQHGWNAKRLPEIVYLRFQVAFGYLLIVVPASRID
ncbi:hypothetical protein EIKCOROL_02460 [Eikenella corrodens ATCC 23834]|uniref:Uncharacterized protein n=1 Tax=Eikenella corrodens ATCC 23834 TaxID=546274 RepID=C0DYJ6_EIKCO|nr:hypothetical protein EIKCOROL_02460 [Eikenella corrodens ATCC 23834]